jgi:hypothetical protein
MRGDRNSGCAAAQRVHRRRRSIVPPRAREPGASS